MKLQYPSLGELPEDKQYVLAHLTLTNWGDMDDPERNRYWVVVKFVRGISTAERKELSDCERKRIHQFGDEGANNDRAYGWTEFGPGSYFGQEVDMWCELPKEAYDAYWEQKK